MLEDPTLEVTSEPTPEASPVSLLVYHRQGVRVVRLRRGQPVVIGRSPPADIAVSSQSLSRQHARFEYLDGTVWVEDLGSKNGTTLNGTSVEKAKVLRDDQVGVGGLIVCLHYLNDEIEDPFPSLFSHDDFVNILAQEVTRADTFRRHLAMVVIRQDASDNGDLESWYPRIRKILRSVDRLSKFGPRALQLVLPETGEEEALRVARRIVGERAPKEPPVVCGVALYPGSATSAEALLEASRTAARDATPKDPIRFAPRLNSRELTAQFEPDDSLVVQSPAMQRVFGVVDRVASASIPVLIIGETGSGKEIVAQEIHKRGRREDEPMRCINCAAIPRELVESVLFGHEKGAFTGAEQKADGVFKSADGGTVFLDEVGELSPGAQAALLRVLETKTFTPVGATEEIVVDVRMIAATHRDLEAMAAAKQFRQDLLYRLNTMTIRVPPLRERVEEIVPLAEKFVEAANIANNCSIKRIEPEALGLMCRFRWPGNIRELKNAIEHAVVIAEGDEVSVDDLPERIRSAPSGLSDLENTSGSRLQSAIHPAAIDLQTDAAQAFKDRVRRAERAVIRGVLDDVEWNRGDAAERLQMPVRTLGNKIRNFGMVQRDLVEADRAEETREREYFNEKAGDPSADFKTRVLRFEAALISDALESAGGNKAEAARQLRIPLRTLIHKIRAYDL